MVSLNPAQVNLFQNTIASYKSANRDCASMSDSDVLQKMLQEGIITKEEFDSYNQNVSEVSADIFVSETSGTQTSDDTGETSFAQSTQSLDPLLLDLPLDDNGKMDVRQFSKESLQKRFPSTIYEIVEEDGRVSVRNRATDKFVLVYQKNGKFNFYTKFGSDGKASKFVDFDDEGNIDSVTTRKYNGDIAEDEVYTRDKNNEFLLSRRGKIYPNNDMDSTFYEGDKVKRTVHVDAEKKVSIINDFINGELWSTMEYAHDGSYTKTNYPLVDSLVESFTKADASDAQSVESLKEKLLSNITEENINEILRAYEEQTGRQIGDDIVSNSALSDDDKKKLLKHLSDCNSAMFGKYMSENSVETANKLKEHIANGDMAALNEELTGLSPSELLYTIVAYRNIACNARNDLYHTIIEDEETATALSNKYGTNFIQEIVDREIPAHGLISAIFQSENLSQESKDSLINTIKNKALANLSDFDRQQSLSDMTLNSTDPQKLEIDIIRALNVGDTRNTCKDTAITTPNGVFDAPIRQGSTGDCWLLAGIISLVNNPRAKEILESRIVFDETTRNYTVNLRSGSFVVTQEEILNRNRLASGDADARIIEIAMDKLMQSRAYQEGDNKYLSVDTKFNNISGEVDINGNYTSFLYDEILGSSQPPVSITAFSSEPVVPTGPIGEIDMPDAPTGPIGDSPTLTMVFAGSSFEPFDVLTHDFNNENKVYSLGTSDEPASQVMAKNDKDEMVQMVSRHAYAIVGSDEENLFIINPWDSETILTLSRKDFLENGYNIYMYNVN